ncbi:MAG: UvrD-helicase domain-containing protein [Thiohalospira sp.]
MTDANPLQGLNPPQREAARHVDSPLLVLAGAGSGKTRVITAKIAYLANQCGLPARNIAAVTFTNKAAREMKSRVAGQLGNARGLRVSTFHTLGLDILRHETRAVGLRPGFSIYDASDAQALVRDLLRRANTDDDLAQAVAGRISRWKNDRITPEAAAAAEAEDPADIAAARVYAEYTRHLRAYNAVDFDDLIGLPVGLFESDAEALARWQQRIRYLLVDEYQDTNAAQYRLVRLLVGDRNGLTVVGDDDQSIYAWRGARPENLEQLRHDYPDLHVVKLEQNYRSVTRILRAANHLIAYNPHLYEKRLWSELGTGDPIRVLETRNEEHEAERVASELMHHRLRHGNDWRDYAILYRGNYQARAFEKALREYDIPYTLTGGQSFFAHTEIKDLMAYLRLLANPADDAAFLRVVNTPRRGIGATTVERLNHYAREREVTLLSACFEMGITAHLDERAVDRLHGFADWIADLVEEAPRESAASLTRRLLAAMDYETWLTDTSKSPAQAERRWGNVTELVAWLERLAEREDGPEELGELVRHLTLVDVLSRQEDDEEGPDAVNLMTLHAAKGLEFPHVFLVGMEESILPHHSAVDGDSVEEERRLAYVGLTRAQRSLTLTLARQRQRGGEKVSCDPSRFLEELPADELHWPGRDGAEEDPTERRERNRSRLAALRGMLDGE